MAYDDLVDRLSSDALDVRVVTFPDGSVDDYYVAVDETGDRIDDREAFGEQIAQDEAASIPIERDSREPGGQAPNMARQAHRLGAETTCYGHLDDPVFDDLPFETVSMGEPSRVRVFPLADDDLLFTELSAAVRDWTLEDLRVAVEADGREASDPRSAAPAAPRGPSDLAADAICCGNWATIDGLTDALAALADGPLEADVLVLDPGSVRGRSSGEVSALRSVLGDLEERIDVVYSVNRAELGDTVEAIGAGDDDGASATTGGDSSDAAESDDRECLQRVREAAGITAVVLHEAETAAVATRDGERVVPNLAVETPQRRTGAGDCFSAAVAVARARGWGWEPALALGNCCAAYYVETGAAGDREDLRSYLERIDSERLPD